MRLPFRSHSLRIFSVPSSASSRSSANSRRADHSGEPTGELTARQIQQLDKLLKEKMDNLDLQTFQGLRPVG